MDTSLESVHHQRLAMVGATFTTVSIRTQHDNGDILPRFYSPHNTVARQGYGAVHISQPYIAHEHRMTFEI
jgi:hypothetical protein